MKNPVVIRKRTPSGGDYSELWLFTKDGRLAQTKGEATHFKLLELKENGNVVQETDGTMERG